jgi:poly(beta-D-mannuronate) lyase
MLLRLWLLVLATGVGSTIAQAQEASGKSAAIAPPAADAAKPEPLAGQPPAPPPPPASDQSETPDPSLEKISALRFVDSIATLQAAIIEAAPGETIVVKDGVYTVNAAINVVCRGTAALPITITAENIGGVEIAGTHGFKASAPAAHVVISGFRFTHAAGRAAVGDGTSHVRFTRNAFLCAGEGHSLSIVGDDAQIDYNEFGPKKSPGTMIAVSGTGSQVARRLWIHHNFFHDFENDGSNGAEMLRFGLLSAHRLSVGSGLVEHNLFVRCRGVNDLISNRSSGNTYRYNTFLDSPAAHLTVRQGNDCAIYGNVFRNTEGVRLYGDRHQVFNNYLEGNYIGIAIGNGDAEISDLGDAGSPNSHDRPDGCVIAFNTFVENNTHYQMSKRSSSALGATNTTFANNLLQGGAVAAKIDGPNAGAVWEGNLHWNVAKLRDLPAEGQPNADPLLAEADGIKRPQAGSPAIGAATGTFPGVTLDFEGQPRAEKKSIGADEPGIAPAIARLLSTSDVGPAASANPDRPTISPAPVTASPPAIPAVP